jgi:Dolichyl-phosphate-mannose-protein mannosyltransferase
VSFTTGIILVALGGFGVRLAYAVAGGGNVASGDGVYYHAAANVLVDGGGFVNPWNGVPTALHPPGWPALLAVPSVAGLDTLLSHQVFACLVGVTTVVLVGVAARTIAGARAGLIAATIAAVYPNVWLRERELAAETLIFPLIAIVLVLVYRFLANRRTVTLAALGGACAVLALVRAEQVLLLFVLAALVFIASSGPASRRLAQLAAGVGVAVVVLLPWVIYNATRFEEPVLLTTGFGVTLRGANCPGAYYGEQVGSLDPDIWRPPQPGGAQRCAWNAESADESEQDAEFRDKGLAYIHEHAERLPVVLAAREGRTWGLFRPLQQANLEQDWGHQPIGVYWAGLWFYYALIPFAVVGVARLRTSGTPCWPLLSFLALTAFAVAITYGNVRFRASAEVPIVVLAAVGVDSLWRRLRPPPGCSAPSNASTTSSASVSVMSV